MSDLSDLPGDDAVELASRYVDGDLSSDERAAAEADPDVMAWVERFGGIQQALREPVEVDAGTRDAAITAALTALDESPEEAVAPPPGVGDLAAERARRTRRLGAWLGSAAAVVALGIGGAVLVANSGGSDDSADEQGTFAASIEVAPAATDAKDHAAGSASSPLAAPAPGANESTTADETMRTGESATTTAAGGDTDTAADAEATGGAPATTAASSESTATGAATTAAPTSADVGPFEQPADLQQLADASPVTMPDGRDAPCADQGTGDPVAVDALYRGEPAVVYRDSQTHTLTAWALDSCERLVDYSYSAD